MTVAGIDLSTRGIDIVLLHDNHQAERFTFPLEGELAFDRCRHVRRALPGASWWENHGVYLAGIEKPMRRHTVAVAALMRVQGAIIARLPEYLTVVETPVTEWKRLFVGKGNASKREVAETGARLLDHWPHLKWPQDAYDALGIACAVRDLNDQAIRKGRAA